MPESPRILDQLGPYLRHPPVKACCDLSEQCWRKYHEAVDPLNGPKETPRQHLVVRMMYMAESTSTAIRLDATWALSLPAMSLLRDRYEQTVRFSWLARQPDHAEFIKYVGDYYYKANKLYRSMTPRQRAEFDKLRGPPEDWELAEPTKQERAYLGRWSALALDAMAIKRDELPPLANTKLDIATLADLYLAVYRQFSSIAHYDLYGMRMLDLHPRPDGPLVLAPDPQWPAMLCLYNALFDLIQCHEALLAFFNVKGGETFSAMYADWNAKA